MKAIAARRERSESARGRAFWWLLIAMALTAAALRWHGISAPRPASFDESLHQELGYQLYLDPGDYSPRPVYRKLLELGREPPSYLDQPLYKHPPLFSYAIATAIALFGVSVPSSYLPPVFFGALTVLLAGFLGLRLHSRTAGLLAAGLLAIDPIHWICSEKVWLETTQAFFCLSALGLFARGLERRRLLIWAGVSLGLACLVKYTSILAGLAFLVFAACFRRDLFRDKRFGLMWLAAGLVFLPWAAWYLSAYSGFGGLETVATTERVFRHILRTAVSSAPWIAAGAAAIALLRRLAVALRKRFSRGGPPGGPLPIYVWAAAVVSLAAFAAVPYLREVILPLRIPEAGSARGMFCPSSPSFYLLRLPRLSPFYLVAFLSLLRFGAPHPAGRLLEVYSLVVLIFHSWWGNYQSRYIAAAVPALLLLAAMAIASAGESLGRLPSPRLRRGGQALLLLIVFWLALKTLWIDWNIALPNAVVYF